MARIRSEMIDIVASDFLASSSVGAFYHRLLSSVSRASIQVDGREGVERLAELVRSYTARPVDETDIEIAIWSAYLLAKGIPGFHRLLGHYFASAPRSLVTAALERLLAEAGLSLGFNLSSAEENPKTKLPNHFLASMTMFALDWTRRNVRTTSKQSASNDNSIAVGEAA